MISFWEQQQYETKCSNEQTNDQQPTIVLMAMVYSTIHHGTTIRQHGTGGRWAVEMGAACIMLLLLLLLRSLRFNELRGRNETPSHEIS